MTKQRGGSRPGNPNGRRGGARKGAGGLVRNIHLSKEVATELRIMTIARRGLTNDQTISPEQVANTLIHTAWLEYDARVQAASEQIQESGIL